MSDVKITQAQLERFERMERKMDALEAGGVDNWEWYGESLKGFHAEEELEGEIDDALVNIAEAIHDSIHEPSERGAGYAMDMDLARQAMRDFAEEAVRIEKQKD